MLDIQYVLVGAVSLLILLLIIVQGRKDQNQNERKKYFDYLIGVTVIFCLIDIFWGLVVSGTILSSDWIVFATTLFYFSSTVVAFALLVFVIAYSGYKLKYRRFVYLVLVIPLVIETALLFYNFSSGAIFYVGTDRRYTRGIDSFVKTLYVLDYIYFFVAFIISICAFTKFKKENRKLSYSIVLFCLIPIVTGFLQLLYPNIPYYSIGYMLSCFSIFIFEVVRERERFSRELLRHQQKDILDACSNVLYRNSVPDETINTLIGLLANYYIADRVLLFQLTDDKKGVKAESEWLANGVDSIADEIESIPSSIVEMLVGYCYNDGEYYLNVTEKTTFKTAFFRLFVQQNKIKNIQVVPLIAEGQIIGMIEIENSKEYLHDITIAKTVSFLIYSELLRKRRMEQEKAASGAVIEALAVEYASVFHIDVKDDMLTPYRLDERMKKMYGYNLKKKLKYEKAYKYYINHLITDELDRIEMLEFCSKESLMHLLHDRTYITKKYKITTDTGYEYYEAKIVKVKGDDGVVNSIVIGIENIDEKIKAQQLEEKNKMIQQKKLESAMEEVETIIYEGQFDKLTGIYNKTSGTEIMHKYLNAKDDGIYYVLLFIDLDKFKYINDNFGHLEGDDILSKVGSVIKSNCRVGDIAVRFGGDEFLVMLKNISDVSLAKKKADLIATEITRISYGKEYSSTCSIGGFITNTRDLEKSMENADKALYEVKNKGRNGIKIVADEVV